jgi:hypothetical protein
MLGAAGREYPVASGKKLREIPGCSAACRSYIDRPYGLRGYQAGEAFWGETIPDRLGDVRH